MWTVYAMLIFIIFFAIKQVNVIYKRGKFLRILHEKEIEFFEYYNFMEKYYERNSDEYKREIRHLNNIRSGFFAHQKLMKYDYHNVEDPDRDFVKMLKTDEFLKDAQKHIKKFGLKFQAEYRESRLDKLLKRKR